MTFLDGAERSFYYKTIQGRVVETGDLTFGRFGEGKTAFHPELLLARNERFPYDPPRTKAVADECRRLKEDIARTLGIHRTTVYRHLEGVSRSVPG